MITTQRRCEGDDDARQTDHPEQSHPPSLASNLRNHQNSDLLSPFTSQFKVTPSPRASSFVSRNSDMNALQQTLVLFCYLLEGYSFNTSVGETISAIIVFYEGMMIG